MPNGREALERAELFAKEYGLDVPILLAPMAGACPPSLSIAVSKGGGMGACGALLMDATQIGAWVKEMRSGTNGAYQLNTWIPDAAPVRDRDHEASVRAFLQQWGPEVSEEAAEAPLRDFESQCEAMLEAGPSVISSIMGLYPAEFVRRMKDRNIRWFATVTTVAEAIEAQQAGADVIVAQGMEAGGHRGAFRPSQAQSEMVGLFSLLPAVRDAVSIPVVATGGIADSRGIAAALILGASAVQIGTGFLRAPEAGMPVGWSDAIGRAAPEDTVATTAFTGRLGRAIRNKYTTAASAPQAPAPASYPIQRNLTQAMRSAAAKSGDIDRMQAWAGQSARLAPTDSAEQTVVAFWKGARAILL
jgi:nitronate monooxygenase